MAYHSAMPNAIPDYTYRSTPVEKETGRGGGLGVLTESGFRETVAIVNAMKEVCGEKIGLASRRRDCHSAASPLS